VPAADAEEQHFLLLMLAVTLAAYAAGVVIARSEVGSRRRLLELTAAVVACLGRGRIRRSGWFGRVKSFRLWAAIPLRRVPWAVAWVSRIDQGEVHLRL
jgi:hypothetical protein